MAGFHRHTLVQFYVRDTHNGNPDSISKSTPLPDWLLKYHEWSCNNTELPRYLISTYEAQALVFVSRLVGAKRGMSFQTALRPVPQLHFTSWLTTWGVYSS